MSVPIPRKPEKHTIADLFDELRKFENDFHTKKPSEVLNPRNLLNYCTELADDEKNLVSIAHCLWGFSRCSQLSVKDDNGYLCEKCSYKIEQQAPAEEAVAEESGEKAQEEQQQQQDKTSNEEATPKLDLDDSIIKSTTGDRKKDNDKSDDDEEDSDDEEEDGDEEEAKKKQQAEEEEAKQTKQRPRQLRDAIRQTSFWQPPEILNIHLKRFVREDELHGKRKKNRYSFMDNGGYVKNQEHVQFPFKLDLTPFIHPSSPYAKMDNDYSLYAVVVHQGELNFGHYVAMVRRLHVNADGNDTRGKWYYISDTHVKEAAPKDVKNCGGYMLFYERINKS